MRRAWTTLCFTLACAKPPASTPVDTDVVVTDTAPESDADPCQGTLTPSLVAAAADLGRFPVSWDDQDLTLSVGSFGSGLQADVVDGCLQLAPGQLTIDVLPRRCAAVGVRARVVDACGDTCTRLAVYSVDTPAGEDRTTRSGAEEVLELATTTVFTRLVVASLDAKLCGVEIDLAPLPDELLPEDTSQPF